MSACAVRHSAVLVFVLFLKYFVLLPLFIRAKKKTCGFRFWFSKKKESTYFLSFLSAVLCCAFRACNMLRSTIKIAASKTWFSFTCSLWILPNMCSAITPRNNKKKSILKTFTPNLMFWTTSGAERIYFRLFCWRIVAFGFLEKTS